MIQKQIELLSALVEDCERGSDNLVLTELNRKLAQILTETERDLFELGNTCNTFWICITQK